MFSSNIAYNLHSSSINQADFNLTNFKIPTVNFCNIVLEKTQS
jgi:hypothetical protein